MQFGLKWPVVERSHAYSQDVPARFERDMGYSKKEFLRLLPAAIGDYEQRLQGQRIVVSHPQRAHTLSLKVSSLPDRVLGAFRIERVAVRFEFLDFTDSERSAFMRHFDRRYQRGGG